MCYGFINNPTAWGIMLLLIVILFGGKNIPEMMKGLGQGLREFKKNMESDEEPQRSPVEREARIRAELEIEQGVRLRLEAERRRNAEKAGTQEGSP